MSETLYMRISTKNIACSQRQMNTCHTSFSYILRAYGEHIMSKWSSRTFDQFIWLASEKKTEAVNAYLIKNSKTQTARDRETESEGLTDRQTDRQTDTDRGMQACKQAGKQAVTRAGRQENGSVWRRCIQGCFQHPSKHRQCGNVLTLKKSGNSRTHIYHRRVLRHVTHRSTLVEPRQKL